LARVELSVENLVPREGVEPPALALVELEQEGTIRHLAEKFEKRVQDYKDNWDEELEQYLGEVPHFDGVERNVRRALRKAG